MDELGEIRAQLNAKPDPWGEWQALCRHIEDRGRHTMRSLLEIGVYARGVTWALTESV